MSQFKTNVLLMSGATLKCHEAVELGGDHVKDVV